MKLLSISSDAKTVKGEALGYLTGVMYLAPAKLSGYQVCPKASDGCSAACLGWYAGRANIVKKGGSTNKIRDARIAKTRWFFEDREGFMAQLVKEIAALVRKAERDGMVPVVRLNGSSDIPWERVPIATRANGLGDGLELLGENIMELFPDVQFYDYTKRANRKDLPANYHLTFSLAEDNDAEALEALGNGMNVAMVVTALPEFASLTSDDKLVPCYWLDGSNKPTWRVIDGDDSDLRFKDPKGVIVGLKAKGDARKDTSGFVR
jgi:hypothetical protein